MSHTPIVGGHWGRLLKRVGTLLGGSLLASTLAPTSAFAGDGVRRIGLAPVSLTGDGGAHIDEHFEQRLRMAMQAQGLELVRLAGDWPEDCDASPCISVAADKADVQYVVRAKVEVQERDYLMHIGLYNASGFEVRAVDASCDICTYAEAAERLGFEVAAFRGRLSVGGAELAGSEASQPKAPKRASAQTLGGVGKLDHQRATIVGAGLVGGGLLFALGGASMIALEEKNYGPKCDGANTDAVGNCEFRHKSKEGGIALTVIGLGTAVSGAVVLGLAHRGKSGEVAVRPGIGSLKVQGRF